MENGGWVGWGEPRKLSPAELWRLLEEADLLEELIAAARASPAAHLPQQQVDDIFAGHESTR